MDKNHHPPNIVSLVNKKLGERSAKRFSELMEVPSGWNFGTGEKMSELSKSNFSAMLSRIKNHPKNSRLFLSDDGSIEMRWSQTEKLRASIISNSQGFEIYNDEGREEVFDYSGLENVLNSVGLI